MNDLSLSEIHLDTEPRINRQEEEANLLQQLQWNTKRFMLSHTSELGFIKPRDYETILNSPLTLGQEQRDGESLLIGSPSRIAIKDSQGKTIETYENPARIEINGTTKNIWITFDREGTPHKIFDKPAKELPTRRKFLKLVGGATLGLLVAAEATKIPGAVQDAGALLAHLGEQSKAESLPEMNTEIKFADAYSVMPSIDGNTIIAVGREGAEALRNTVPGPTPETVPVSFEWFNNKGEKIGENSFPIYLDTGNGSIEDVELAHTISVGDKIAIYYHHKADTADIEASLITPDNQMSTVKSGTVVIPGTNMTWRLDGVEPVLVNGQQQNPRKKLFIGEVRGHEIIEAPMLVASPTENESFDIFASTSIGSFVVRHVTTQEGNSDFKVEHSLYSQKGEFIMNFPDTLTEYSVNYVDEQNKMMIIVDNDATQENYLKIYSVEKGLSQPQQLQILKEGESTPRNIQYTITTIYGDTIVAASLETFDPDAEDRGIQVQTFDLDGNPLSTKYIDIPHEYLTEDYYQPFLWSMHDSYLTFYKQSGSLINIPYTTS